MRPILDTDDLATLHRAGVGYVHNPDGQILHAAGCEHVALMGPARKLHFATLDEAEDHLTADPRRRWRSCPSCLPSPPSRPASALANPPLSHPRGTPPPSHRSW